MTRLMSNRERFFLGIIFLLVAVISNFFVFANIQQLAIGFVSGLGVALIISSVTTQRAI